MHWSPWHQSPLLSCYRLHYPPSLRSVLIVILTNTHCILYLYCIWRDHSIKVPWVSSPGCWHTLKETLPTPANLEPGLCVFCVHIYIADKMTCLLDAKAEVEQTVRAVRPPIGPFHLRNEAAETVAELSCGALENILLQHHQTCWNQHNGCVTNACFFSLFSFYKTVFSVLK